MIQNPIFLIGTERSGSNLLRLILNAHPNIAIPHPPHVMRDLKPHLEFYGDLREDQSFRHLADDLAGLVRRHFAPWPFLVTGEGLVRQSPSRSLYGLYAALYEMYRVRAGKARWGCKSTFMYSEIGQVLRHHEGPQFIHLVRDPRDVAASAADSVFSHFHPYLEARLWRDQQEEIERWSHLQAEGKLLRVRYEDLVRAPETEVRRVMEFLGEEFQAAQLDFFRGKEAGQLSALSESWRNCSRPVSQESVGNFRRRISFRDVTLVESEAAPLMEAYGYSLAAPGARPPAGLELFRIQVQERGRRWRTEFRSMQRDRNFRLRWAKWLFLQRVKWTRRWAHGYAVSAQPHV